MSGFEPWIPGIGSDRSTNCATTTVQTFLNKKPTSWANRFRPCLRPGYFQLQLSDCSMETCMLLAEVRVHECW